MHSYSIDTNERIKVIAYLGIISVILSILLSKLLDNNNFPFASYFGSPSAMALFGVLYYLFNSYIWKWKYLRFIIKTPDLSGVWEGEYCSSYICKDTKQPYKGKIEFTIEQNWTRIRIVSENGKSTSYSEVAGISINDNMGTVLRYQYRNEAKAIISEKTMHGHTGFSKLRYLPDKNVLEGDYFNDKDRKTYGNLYYKKIQKN